MTDRIVIFYGSKKDFEELVATETSKEQVTIPFMELIQHYNARLRPNESGVRESALSRNIDVDNCVVRADDYGSVLEHVLSNFVNVVTLNHDIGTLFVHNPPRKVRDSLRSAYGDDIEYLGTQYPDLSREKLKEVYSNIEKDILGQSNCKKQIISGMYRLIAKANNKPVVLMLYGPSGVGKTESAKSISKTMGGELLRIQFSMMQTTEAYNYVFGAEHSKGSFARDMMARESNVILIDEFDKVNPAFYNAFYELFDEGRYVDTNYDVNLGQAIFLLTCNFGSEEEIKKILGPAMFSRIGCCIAYEELSTEQKQTIVHNWYESILSVLKADEKEEIEKTSNKIYEITGEYPVFIRPPFGEWRQDLELSIDMLPVFWDIDTLDWKSKSVPDILKIVESQIHEDAIILMHDGYETSVEAAFKIIDLLKENRYEFVTVDRLLIL